MQLLFIPSHRQCLLNFKGIHIKKPNSTKLTPNHSNIIKFQLFRKHLNGSWLRTAYSENTAEKLCLNIIIPLLCSHETPSRLPPDLGSPQRKDVDPWSKSRGGHKGNHRAGLHPMMAGCEIWGCLAWRREGSRETLQQISST